MTLEIRGIRFSYGREEILRGIDLDIGPGITSILGPNGAGKSTLMKCLAGVHKPSSGTAMFAGCDLIRKPADGPKVAYLSQDLPTISSMNVLEVMILGRVETLALKVTEEDIDKSYGALESVHMEEFADRTLSELSGGQQQMVMIAQCLVADPDIILLDEPMNNLDLRKELEMFDIMTRITRERDLTTLMVLHDVNFASRYTDRMAVLKDGSIYSFGTPHEVVSADMIRDVYGVEADLYRDSNGLPRIDPLRSVYSRDRIQTSGR